METGDKRLLKAVRNGALLDLIELLKAGVDAREADLMGVTPLMTATLRGHPLCVEALLPASDVNAVDQEGCSALIYAAQHQRLDCLKVLLPFSDATLKNNEGLSALAYANGFGDVEMARLIESYQTAQSEHVDISKAAGPSVRDSFPPRL